MDFLYGQESLTTIQWALRAAIGFIFLLLIAKLLGQRSISQLKFLDFAVALIIGNIMAHPLSDEKLGFKGSMIAMFVIVTLYMVCLYISLKWRVVNRFFDPLPLTLIEKGQVNYQNLKRARITIDFLLSELRKEKVVDIEKVALALWESGGTISIFLDSQYLPVTPKDLLITTKPFNLPETIIKERKIDYHALQRLGKDEQWLLNEVKANNVCLNDILLATMDQNGKLKVFLYE